MTGKQLKEWAAKVSDEVTILIREAGYSAYKDRFDIKAEIELGQSQVDAENEQVELLRKAGA